VRLASTHMRLLRLLARYAHAAGSRASLARGTRASPGGGGGGSGGGSGLSEDEAEFEDVQQVTKIARGEIIKRFRPGQKHVSTPSSNRRACAKVSVSVGLASFSHAT